MPLASAALDILLPEGGERYVALLTAEPDILTNAYVETADGAYLRQFHDAWLTEDNGDGRLRRRNNGAVLFAARVDGPAEITHWAVFDTEADGTLLAFGPVLNTAGDPQPAFLEVGDEFRFNDSTIALLSGC